MIDAVVTATGQSKTEIERTLEAILETVAQALVAGERIDFETGANRGLTVDTTF